MQQVDLILTNAHVLTMDESLAQFNPGAVAIRGDSIVAVDTATAISENYVAREIIDCHGNILMPGLVNVHTHVP
ncbi:MAG TPA: amidohydrolase, partial [Anaerolineaceae bacterium]|nr:amidohydrolase [Anaerolineaceae bacterium]